MTNIKFNIPRAFKVIKVKDKHNLTKKECIGKEYEIGSIHFNKKLVGAQINSEVYEYFYFDEIDMVEKKELTKKPISKYGEAV